MHMYMYMCVCAKQKVQCMNQLRKSRFPRPTPKPKTWMIDLSPERAPRTMVQAQNIRSMFRNELCYIDII